ncbi:MAG: cytochrome c biogenesis protein CcdA [Bdellovibrionota bacterium]
MYSQYYLGFFAGGLSLLAPCVLPILPLIISSSLKSSKFGPLLSALGLTLSFTVFGILTTTFASIFDPDVIQKIGAMILVLVGLFFLIPGLKLISSGIFLKISNLGSSLQSKISNQDPLYEFSSGALLGMIWSPCTGPTLGLAIALASKSENVLGSAFVFFCFGMGAGIGLLALGFLLKKFIFLRIKLLRFGKSINLLTGAISLVLGLLILSGTLEYVEEIILSRMPNFLIKISTQF